jgi:hypothetical protein
MATLNSTVNIAWGTATNPAAQNITIPTGVNAVYMFWAVFPNTNGSGLLSATLNSSSPNETFEVPSVNATFEPATGVAAWYNIPTGVRSLDIEWDAAVVEGPPCIVAFVENANTSGWRDADGGNAESNTQISVTLTTVSGDLVIKFDQRFGNTAPGLSSGWTNGGTQTAINNESARLSYIVATGSTQVCDSENEDYSSLVAISIIDATPAVLSNPTPSGTIGTTTTATIGATTDQPTGTFYCVVDTAANLAGITNAQIEAGQRNDNSPALAANSATVTTTTPSAGVTGLSPGTLYSYAACQDNANGDSNIVTGTFTTAAVTNIRAILAIITRNIPG